jgi:surface protein
MRFAQINYIAACNVLALFALLLFPTFCLGQSFTIDNNGIVKCKGVNSGVTGSVSGVIYESVDRALLIQRRNEGADLTKVCVSNVTDMRDMFENISFNQPIGNWDVSNVTNMSDMFYKSAFNQPIRNWDVSRVTTMSGMFFQSPFNQPIGDWDVGSVTSMSFMFSSGDFNQPIGNWNVSRVTSMTYMFYNTPFDQNISNWNVSNVTNMSDMFYKSAFNQPIGNWDVSRVTTMSGMFFQSPFNHPIDNWDVGNVTSMSFMFTSSEFNQPLGNWNVARVTNMTYMFYNSKFNQTISIWNVSNVINMSNMFYRSVFNRPIGNWNVSSVTDMSWMFYQSEFNQPIGNWDVRNVIDMDWMFRSSKFNHPINEWCVAGFATEPANFASNSLLVSANKPVWGTCPGMPNLIVQISPQNNSNGVDRLPLFTWNADKNATLYQLQIFEGMSTKVLDTTLTASQFAVASSLNGSAAHSWKVRGINSNKNYTGEWSQTWNFTTSMSTSLSLEDLPTQYALHQNYPNPFNPTTVIGFALPSSTHIKLEVFSPVGQLVAILADRNFGTGQHSVLFDASNMSSGVYLYRITTPQGVFTQKMTLIK